jgi:1-acyl-sn-glycerol-3-phosphate acyltransferase
MTASPGAPSNRRPLATYGLLSRLAWAALRVRGWSVEIVDPLPAKCVVIMYPHTSNWDFVVGLAAKWAAGLDAKRDALCFAGKESLFHRPWGAFFRAIGGFPIDRAGGRGFVGEMAKRFDATGTLRFVLSPEGTRSARDHVRSSFYYVALAAKVPILLGLFDFSRRRIVVTEAFWPTGDAAADLATIDAYYQSAGASGEKPERANPWRFRTATDQTSSSSPYS